MRFFRPLLWLLIFPLFGQEFLPTEEILKQALYYYQKGEQAKTYVEREADFNKALTFYLQLENQFNDGRLLYNIGNSYFQLREYPLAILYYYRALQRLPRNEKIEANLTHAQSKLNLPEQQGSGVFKRLLFFHYYFSKGEKWFIFLLLALLSVSFLSILLWRFHRLLMLAATFCVFCTLMMLGSLFVSNYLSSIEAIMIRASILYGDAGTQYSSVKEEPLAAGIKVSVFDITSEGKWLKIQTPDGIMGYVPQESIRLI